MSLAFFFWAAQPAAANQVKETYDQAMAAFMKRDFAQAAELFEETLVLYPNLAQAYNFLAMSKKELGAKDDEVISLLEKSIELDPAFALAYDNLGKMYYGQGKFHEAKAQTKRALEISPDLVTARLSLAWICLLGLGETREAIEHFESALAAQKTDYGQYGLGMAYFMDHQRGRVLEMITNLRQEGNDALAKDLEDMIRNGRYLPPEGMQALINPAAKKPGGVAAATAPEPEADITYPVRLSGRLGTAGPAALPAGADQAGVTGSERIRQLQRTSVAPRAP
jgi:tetratricopeptide (TPR) repeat protein